VSRSWIRRRFSSSAASARTASRPGRARTVHGATLDATAALVREHGLTSVTMSQIAVAAGIGRATLYKYFPDVEAFLVAWQDRHITRHLRQLAEARDSAATPAARLEAVLSAGR